MILIRRNTFHLAKEIGFNCEDPYIRTSHGRQYSISDADFRRMNIFIEGKCKVTKYR